MHIWLMVPKLAFQLILRKDKRLLEIRAWGLTAGYSKGYRTFNPGDGWFARRLGL